MLVPFSWSPGYKDAPTGSGTLQTTNCHAELLVLTGWPRFPADLQGQCSIQSPQGGLCKYPLAPGSGGLGGVLCRQAPRSDGAWRRNAPRSEWQGGVAALLCYPE